MITPTIGRIVWIYGRQGVSQPTNRHAKPEAAMVADCWQDPGSPDIWYLNVGGLNHLGEPFNLTSVRLVQDTSDSDINTARPFAMWMPYQKAVAAGEIPAVKHATPP